MQNYSYREDSEFCKLKIAIFQTQILIQEAKNLMLKPNFIGLLCYATQGTLRPSPSLFPSLVKVLRLSPLNEVSISPVTSYNFLSDVLQAVFSQKVIQNAGHSKRSNSTGDINSLHGYILFIICLIILSNNLSYIHLKNKKLI